MPVLLGQRGGPGVAGADADVVVEHVDATEALEGGVGDPSAGVLVGDVGLEDLAGPALGPDHLGRLGRRGRSTVDGEHLGALPGEQQRRGPPVADRLAGGLTGAGHDGDPAGQLAFTAIAHGSSPSRTGPGPRPRSSACRRTCSPAPTGAASLSRRRRLSARPWPALATVTRMPDDGAAPPAWFTRALEDAPEEGEVEVAGGTGALAGLGRPAPHDAHARPRRRGQRHLVDVPGPAAGPGLPGRGAPSQRPRRQRATAGLPGGDLGRGGPRRHRGRRRPPRAGRTWPVTAWAARWSPWPPPATGSDGRRGAGRRRRTAPGGGQSEPPAGRPYAIAPSPAGRRPGPLPGHSLAAVRQRLPGPLHRRAVGDPGRGRQLGLEVRPGPVQPDHRPSPGRLPG